MSPRKKLAASVFALFLGLSILFLGALWMSVRRLEVLPQPVYVKGKSGIEARFSRPFSPHLLPVRNMEQEMFPFIWVSNQWINAPELRVQSKWDHTNRFQMTVKVPEQKWKLEMRVRREREPRFGSYRLRFWTSNVWTSAELPPLNEIRLNPTRP
jgi:hypothetical protein